MKNKQVKSDWLFLFSHPAHFIALGAGSGLSKFAPGTAGTVFGWLLFLLYDFCFRDKLQPIEIYLTASLLLVLIFSLVAWWASKVSAQHLSVADPSAVVCDEIAAFWLILIFANLGPWWLQILSFILFRFFDAVKFGIVKLADNKFKGFGWRGAFGIMVDDFAAAAMTLIIIFPLVWLNQ